MVDNDLARLDIVSGSLESGTAEIRTPPAVADLRFPVSGRSMSNPRALFRFGESCRGSTFLAMVSGEGGLLLACDLPLPDETPFEIAGERLTIRSPAPVRLTQALGPEIITGQTLQGDCVQLQPHSCNVFARGPAFRKA